MRFLLHVLATVRGSDDWRGDLHSGDARDSRLRHRHRVRRRRKIGNRGNVAAVTAGR